MTVNPQEKAVPWHISIELITYFLLCDARLCVYRLHCYHRFTSTELPSSTFAPHPHLPTLVISLDLPIIVRQSLHPGQVPQTIACTISYPRLPYGSFMINPMPTDRPSSLISKSASLILCSIKNLPSASKTPPISSWVRRCSRFSIVMVMP